MLLAEVLTPFDAQLFHIAVTRNVKTRNLEKVVVLVGHQSKAVIYDLNAHLEITRERRARTQIRDIVWGSIENNGMLLWIGENLVTRTFKFPLLLTGVHE